MAVSTGAMGEAAGCDNEIPMRCISRANNRGGRPRVPRARGESRTDRRMENGRVPGGGGSRGSAFQQLQGKIPDSCM